MRTYLSHLRRYLWAAAVLPLANSVVQIHQPFIITPFGFLSLQYIFIVPSLVLFFLAGRKAASGGYSVSKACFAGPVLLFVSHIIIGVPLAYITVGPYFRMGQTSPPTWLRLLLLPFTVILTYLILFPVTLGVAALAAHLYWKRK